MEPEKNNPPKQTGIWTLQSFFAIAIAALAFFQYVSILSATLLFFILIANSIIFAALFSNFKKGREFFNTETEQKSKQISEFDKITRQLVKRDLELARANQRLQELDTAKSDFVSVAAHQLRTPLTGIKWSYTALIDPDTGPLNPTQKEIVEKGLASISNTLDLINDLLNVAHVEEGKMKFEIKRQSIIPIAKKAMEGIKLVADEKKIAVSVKIPEESGFPDVNIDTDKMELALANLADNAVKYTPEGGRIDFTVSQEQGAIKIVVQDSGIGIPKSQKDRLFSKFFRADNAVSVQTSGTGLGLYMVKKIIDRHGGKIVVDSVEGKGTAFIVTIPEATAKKTE
ncbi:MAG TPA: HAMP domain-containing sensor histidine kinase [Candidatus Bathyarchaeia archaeon]|nr:HAMP domain-containing sensor histidine kinase [Candidatus Bathyarchaeia archaeon]